MNEYEQKQDARRARLLARAEKAHAAAAGAETRASAIADMIPLGQPVLVGHHSEKRHRRDIARIQGGFAKAHELRQHAGELEQRAAAVGSAGVSSDDPDAIAKLREQLAGELEQRETIKRVNAVYRKAAKAGDSAAAWRAVAEIVGEAQAIELARRAAFHQFDVPYPSFKLTNLGASIRRIEQRIAQLELEARARASAPVVPVAFSVGRVEERPDIHRIAIVFGARQPAEVVDVLKRGGWRWSPREGAWLRHLNDNGRAAARYAVEQIERAIAGAAAP